MKKMKPEKYFAENQNEELEMKAGRRKKRDSGKEEGAYASPGNKYSLHILEQ